MKENLKYAFIWAAEYGDVPLFITLYSRGAENLPDHNGYTALMAAARKGHTDIVKMLLSLPGHQLDTTDDYDKTALDYAKENEHAEIVEMLRAARRKNS